MKQPNQEHLMAECYKILLPNLNRDAYSLVCIDAGKNVGQKQSIYEKRLTITIQEISEYSESLDSHLWHIHGYAEHTYEDRPIRDNAVTIIERRRKRRNKESKKVYISQIAGYKKFEGMFRSEDEIHFLK